MHKINIDEIKEKSINRGYRKGVSIRYLVVEEFGAPNFEMRYFELEKGVATSLDVHPSEHEVFVVRGQGTLILKGKEYPLRPNDALLIEPNEQHQFRHRGDGPFGFICMVPNGISKSKNEVDLNY